VRKLLLTLALSLSAALPAWSADQALIDAAKKEGKVVWYTSLIQDQAVRPLAKAFEAKYPGVKVDAVTGKTSELLLRITDEIKAGALQADVHHGGGAAQELLAKGALEKFIPDSAASFPADLKDTDGYWTAHVVNFLVPAYNTDMVQGGDIPKTYEDLLDPKWKGQIAWAASMSQGGPPGFIGTVLGVMGEEKGMDYLRKLAQQKIVNVPTNQRVVVDQVMQGEYPLALCTFSHHSDISAAQGAPVKWAALGPAVTNTIDPIFLLKGAPHPNAGKLLIDFIESDEGQQALAKANYIPANPKFRKEGSDPKAFTLTPQLIAKDFDRWVSIYNELFK
jgi:iron(III) transport system substrate-binding protein